MLNTKIEWKIIKQRCLLSMTCWSWHVLAYASLLVSILSQYWVLKWKWKWSCSVVSDSLHPVDCSPPRSSVHGILQARILEWVAMPIYRVPNCNRYHQFLYAHLQTIRFQSGLSNVQIQWHSMHEWTNQKSYSRTKRKVVRLHWGSSWDEKSRICNDVNLHCCIILSSKKQKSRLWDGYRVGILPCQTWEWRVLMTQ